MRFWDPAEQGRAVYQGSFITNSALLSVVSANTAQTRPEFSLDERYLAALFDLIDLPLFGNSALLSMISANTAQTRPEFSLDERHLAALLIIPNSALLGVVSANTAQTRPEFSLDERHLAALFGLANGHLSVWKS